MKSFDVLDPKTPVEGHHFLQASAGTGKTFAIEHVTIRLLLKNIPLERILLVTFTRAATRELKARLQKAIYKALYSPDAPYMNALKGCSSARFALEKALALINDAQIFTIHGFCLRMLKEYAFEAELDFNLLGEKEEPLHADHLKEEITHFFRTGLKQEDVSASQLSAILKNDPKGLIKHLSTLIEKEGSIPYFPPFKQSYLSFKEALLSLPKFSLEDFYKILPFFNKMNSPSFSEQIKILENPFTEEMFDHFLSFPKNVFSFLKKENVKKRKKEPLPKEADLFFNLSEALLPIIETAKNPLHTLCRIARSCQETRSSQEGFNQGLFPGDILKKMKKSIERPAFIDQVRGRFDAAIIDEFQDTDPLQWSIFKRLFIEKPISTLFLVGDPKQSIYSFRNSDIYSYLNAGKEVKHHAYLGTNYRSDPHLTTLLNALFSKNPHFLSLPDAPLPYRAVSSPKNSTKASIKDDKSPVHFFIYEKERVKEKSWPTKEMEETIFFPFIAKEILHLKKEGVPLEEIAILVKDRFEADHLSQFLLSYGISTVSKGGGDLTKTPSFILFLFLLEAVFRPNRTQFIKRFFSHPLLPFTHHHLKEGGVIAEGIALFTELSRVFKEQGLENMFAKALVLPFKENQTLEALILAGGGVEAFSDFQKTLALALEYRAVTKLVSLRPLIQHFHMLRDEGGDFFGLKRHVLNDKEGVSLMTIHMSKGLEFSFVFALGLIKRHTKADPFLYHNQQWVCSSLDEKLYQAALKNLTAEKLRQLYVALTRAKKRVYVPALISTKELDVLKPGASPLEVFLKELLPLKKSLDEMGISYTYLSEECAFPQVAKPVVVFKEPQPVSRQFASQELSSFSSLAIPKHCPFSGSQADLLPAGVETGQLLHALIEKLIIEGVTAPYHQERAKHIICSHLSKTPFQPYEKEVIECVLGAFETPLGGICLKDIDQDKLFVEVEFHYLKEDGNMIKGLVDLIFQVENTFYIVDWKSNALPNYQESNLIEAMKNHDYFLQEKLYSTFLKRYLKQKKDKAHFGGTFYVFLRGLKQGLGIHFLP